MPLWAAVWRKLAAQRSNPASASAGESSMPRPSNAAAADAGKAPDTKADAYIGTHLFLLREIRKTIHR